MTHYVKFNGSIRHLAEATLVFEQVYALLCDSRPVKTITTPKGAKVMVFAEAKKSKISFESFYKEAIQSLKEKDYNGLIPRIVIPT